MFVEHQTTVYDARVQPEDRRVAFFDSLLQSSSGTWFCGFTVGRIKHDPRGTLGIQRSRDGGASWQPLPVVFETQVDGIPGSLAGAEMVELRPGRLLLFTTWFDRSDPERPLFDPVTEGILRSRQLVAESLDEGETWSSWRTIATPGLTGTALTGPPICWPDGTLGLPLESFKEFDDPSPPKHGSWLLLSHDGGQTFPGRYLVAQDPRSQVYYWDQRLTPAGPPGEFVALFWTHDRASQRDLNVHLLRARAEVGGAATELPVETSIPGQIAAPLLLEDGRLLAFVVDRDPPGTMRVWSSADGGRTWPVSECLTVHVHRELAALSQGRSDIDYAQYWEDMAKWTFGHPAIRRLDRDRVLVSYYAGVPGCMGVFAATLRTTQGS